MHERVNSNSEKEKKEKGKEKGKREKGKGKRKRTFMVVKLRFLNSDLLAESLSARFEANTLFWRRV